MLLTTVESVLKRSWYLNEPDADSGLVHGNNAAGPLDTVPGEPDHSGFATRLATSVNLVKRQGDMFFADARRREVNRHELVGRPEPIFVISNPNHIRSLMVADPSDVQSASHTSPLRPIVGPNSVITANGDRHRQQRGLLLPEFHGKSVARYQSTIDATVDRHIDRLSVGSTFAMSDFGQAITLDIIMSAVFGIGQEHEATRAESNLRKQIVRTIRKSTMPGSSVVQMLNAGSSDAIGMLKLVVRPLDNATFAVIDERRQNASQGTDILSVLMAAKTENGEGLSDQEIRDELLTLLLAGHGTTSDTLAWTFERLTRHAHEYHRVQDEVRSGGGADLLTAVIYESMRSRPVVPIFARQVLRPWQFGNEQAATGDVALISAILLHHRDELYPKPFAFQPDRFLGSRPAPYTFMPFGGGNRRCLGATLAMAELQTVTRRIIERVDLQTHERPPEAPHHRNVTMIPANGGIVKAIGKRSG